MLTVLHCCNKEQLSARRRLMILGLKNYEEMHRQLALMEESESTLMALHWFVRNGKQKEQITLRFYQVKTHQSYCAKMRINRGKLYVSRLCHRPDLMANHIICGLRQ